MLAETVATVCQKLSSGVLLEQQELEAVYKSAYECYESQDYSQAAALFSAAVLASGYDPVLWQGLAASRQMEGSFEEAIKAWSMVSLLQPSTALPHFHIAECLFQTNQREEAKKALLQAKKLTSDPTLSLKIERLYEQC